DSWDAERPDIGTTSGEQAAIAIDASAPAVANLFHRMTPSRLDGGPRARTTSHDAGIPQQSDVGNRGTIPGHPMPNVEDRQMPAAASARCRRRLALDADGGEIDGLLQQRELGRVAEVGAREGEPDRLVVVDPYGHGNAARAVQDRTDGLTVVDGSNGTAMHGGRVEAARRRSAQRQHVLAHPAGYRSICAYPQQLRGAYPRDAEPRQLDRQVVAGIPRKADLAGDRRRRRHCRDRCLAR